MPQLNAVRIQVPKGMGVCFPCPLYYFVRYLWWAWCWVILAGLQCLGDFFISKWGPLSGEEGGIWGVVGQNGGRGREELVHEDFGMLFVTGGWNLSQRCIERSVSFPWAVPWDEFPYIFLTCAFKSVHGPLLFLLVNHGLESGFGSGEVAFYVGVVGWADNLGLASNFHHHVG